MNKIIDINQLNISTDTQKIINNFDLSIDTGEWIGLKGPSGSGKSTILKYMAQLLDPSLTIAGEYHFKNKNIFDYEPTNIRKNISYCFQNPSLFDKTVYDNLSFPFEIRNKKFNHQLACDYLNRVGLNEDYIEKNISTLSGGEKQRISLIRNLLIPPEVILLDEISSALDKKTREIVWSWIKEYKNKHSVTIIMVTHLDEEYQLADRIFNIGSENKKVVD